MRLADLLYTKSGMSRGAIGSMQSAVVIPCYRSKDTILEVLSNIGNEISHIIVIDDCCPQQTGSFVAASTSDPRVNVIALSTNLGVGGATIEGYKEAIRLGADVVVKVDSDGQMDPSEIPRWINTLIQENVGYVTGNRFARPRSLYKMPLVRLIGNLVLTLLARLSTGYGKLWDPNNGFTAISSRTLAKLPLEKIDKGYFFESDMLFYCNRAGVLHTQVAQTTIYNNHSSNLNVFKCIPEFTYKHLRNYFQNSKLRR